ncbi:DUF7151 family protein [Bradymonas sediminis]|uniref:DUF7151 domain-containing protein n=1 Tax=Bradymonas sediminis TaxID=1548548 RepID=A0A2Z4FJ11_9DELT|nr:hypothetical protein [Bradymonas sediminis]AWV88923.1 hypothetical protein DN745_06045 [Bradymonas sediminis]
MMNRKILALAAIALLATSALGCGDDASGNGSKAHNSLVNLVEESAGENCENGGQAIQTGLDANDNGVLDADEVAQTAYICNSAPGKDGALVNLADEPAGENCENGGKVIQTGVDTNSDGTLGADEVTQTSYVCDTVDGEDGVQTLVAVNEEPLGDNCPAGGSRIEVGADTSADGILDVDEVTQTTFICEEKCPGSMILSQPANACVEPQLTLFCTVEMALNPTGLYPYMLGPGTPCRVDLVYDTSQPESGEEFGQTTYAYSDAPNGIYVTLGDEVFYTNPAPDALLVTVHDTGTTSTRHDRIRFESLSNQMPAPYDGTSIMIELSSSDADTLTSNSLADATAALHRFEEAGGIIAACNAREASCEEGSMNEVDFWMVAITRYPTNAPGL